MKIYPNPADDATLQHASGSKLVAFCGVIPMWLMMSEADAHGEKAMIQAVMDLYGFPTMHVTGVTINEKGYWQYPEDPDLPPVCMFQMENGMRVYAYQYSFFAFIPQDGEPVCLRMD